MKRFTKISVLTVAIGFMAATAAIAATITVTDNSSAGAGTLRQAIIDANDGDTIDFNFGSYPETISLNSQLSVDKNLNIVGRANPNDVQISGNTDVGHRILFCSDQAELNISGLTFKDSIRGGGGGALYIRRINQFSLSNCVFKSNEVSNNNRGGALHLLEVTGTVSFCTFSNNKTAGSDGNNDGGAIAVVESVIDIKNCTFSGNIAGDDGGAVCVRDTGTECNIITCTFFTNSCSGSAAADGGALYLWNGTLNIYNSTIIDNSADHGGGIFRGGGTLNIYSSILGLNTGGEVNGTINTADHCVFSGAPTGNDNVDAVPETGTTLANNGGPTLTIAITGPGNCIDAGANPLSLAFDQRGPGYQLTKSNSKVDAGSFSLIPEPTIFALISMVIIGLIRRK